MGKRKQPQQAATELWQGAGLCLDWRKIRGGGFDKKVGPRLEEIGDKAEVANFAHPLTGRSPNTMAEFYLSAATGSVGSAAVEEAPGQFEKM